MILDIFDKACPQCGATNPSINSRCACGYLYPKDLRLALERDVQQEKTLEKNLAARAEKAAATAGLVAQIAAAEPQNRSKAAAAVKAERTAVAGQVELAQQRVRVVEAKRKLAAHAARESQGTPSGETTDEATLWNTRSWQAMVVREALKAPSMQSTTGVGATASAQPRAAFRAAQVAKADKAMKDLEIIKCPACGAFLSAIATDCTCGWSLSTAVAELEMPSLALSDDERTALTEGFKINRRRKRR